MDLDLLKNDSLALFGLVLGNEQLDAFDQYSQLLADWNQRFNLTAVRDPEGVRVRHFLDSLSCLPPLRHAGGPDVVDVGSGAGFPGLVLKIAAPQLRLTLVESVAKKAHFCEHVAAKLGLEGVRVLVERVEVIGQDPAHRERYDWAIARALAPMPVLAEYLLPLVKVGGNVLAQKGAGGAQEAQTARGTIELLGGCIQKVEMINLPQVSDPHSLVLLEKAAPTPNQYPRRTGVPAKRPLTG
jgi:16S rRNA (guanine527-N7)-methyltransferase